MSRKLRHKPTRRMTKIADRDCKCFFCPAPIRKGKEIDFHKTQVKGRTELIARTVYLPVHPECAKWQHKARNNPKDPLGGYDMPPGTKMAYQRSALRRKNQAIGRNAQFG